MNKKKETRGRPKKDDGVRFNREECVKFAMQCIIDKPTIYTNEIAKKVVEQYGISVVTSAEIAKDAFKLYRLTFKESLPMMVDSLKYRMREVYTQALTNNDHIACVKASELEAKIIGALEGHITRPQNTTSKFIVQLGNSTYGNNNATDARRADGDTKHTE